MAYRSILSEAAKANSPALLLVIVSMLALIVRICWIWAFGDVVENDGATYIRLAENLAAGNGYINGFGGRQTTFPPLYPIVIAFLTSIVPSGEVAARALSCVSGVILLWPLYGIIKYLGGADSALLGAAMAALFGVLVALSGATYSESTYFTLLMSGVYFTCRTLNTVQVRYALAAGLFFGLAYLVRPEGLIYAGLSGVFVAANALVVGQLRRRLIPRLLAFGITAMLVAAPYVMWLSWNSDYFRWEGKTVVNGIISERINQGMTYPEAARGLGPNLEPLGPNLIQDQFLLEYEGSGSTLALATALEEGFARLPALVKQFTMEYGLGGPVFVVLAGIGFIVSLSAPANRSQKVYFALICALYLPILLSLQFVWTRYLFPLSLMALPWAAVGVMWVSKSLVKMTPRLRIPSSTLTTAFAIPVAALAVLPSLGAVSNLGDFGQSSEVAYKTAGQWLRKREPKLVMGFNGVATYYSGAVHAYLPWAEESVALQYVHVKSPDFIIFGNGDEHQAPYLAKWLADGIPDDCARLRREFSLTEVGHLVVYEWSCGGSGEQRTQN